VARKEREGERMRKRNETLARRALTRLREMLYPTTTTCAYKNTWSCIYWIVVRKVLGFVRGSPTESRRDFSMPFPMPARRKKRLSAIKTSYTLIVQLSKTVFYLL